MPPTEERIQNMLCARIDELEKELFSAKIAVNNLHSNINVMQNNRLDENEYRNATAATRTRIGEIVKKTERVLKDK